MEALDLIDPEFWQSNKSLVLANPRDMEAVSEAKIIRPWLEQQSDLKAHVLFRTSGSTGRGKWVAIAKDALLASAQAVNDFLDISPADKWLQTLPIFHVGGVGILTRAHVVGGDVIKYDGKWDAAVCHQLLSTETINLTSFVPAQLADMVKLNLPAPPTMRVVLIGGGRLSDQLYQQAVDLGWPVRETYGMTETASQVATTQAGSRDLEILPCWQVRADGQGKLQISGQALLTTYVGIDQEGDCFSEDPKQDGWLTSNDLGHVTEGHLSVTGRADRCIKILGELINLTDLENSLAEVLGRLDQPHVGFCVVALEEKRAGHRLILCIEDDVDLSKLLEVYHAHCHPLHRIEKAVPFTELPRTGIGKIAYAELKERLAAGGY